LKPEVIDFWDLTGSQQYEDAFAVSDFLIHNFDELASRTRLWRDAWYDSTLPYWFLDRTILNTSILASSTAHLLSDRLFYGWEGGYQRHSTFTHFWGYVQAMQGLTEARDADHDGILTGAQHNTLDADWYGKITWLSLHYTAALRATAQMADEMGDRQYAGFCRQTADNGRPSRTSLEARYPCSGLGAQPRCRRSHHGRAVGTCVPYLLGRRS